MCKKYEVNQIKNNRFLFQKGDTSEKEVEVYLKKHPEDKQQEFLLKTSEPSFSIDIGPLDYRPYFLLKFADEAYTIGERTLPVEGMNNFRDMGGYEAENGKTVKWGMLYRSDHIYNATDAGVAYLKKLNIRTIIDYRSDDELMKYPNKTIDEDMKTYQLDPVAHAAELAAQFTSSKKDEDINLINKIIEQKEKGTLVNQADVVLEQYRTFANKENSKQAFGEMLRITANPDAPAVVQHCRGGKDRTGFGAMLVLGILGVKKEDLVRDYMLTEKNRQERNRIKMEGYKKLTDDKEVLDHLYSFIDTRSEFIATSIDTIIQKYGSIEKYVMEELGITGAMIDTMKDMYLE
ncbi:tyrosine-protein phosphatase [Oceanobacillus jeddahense]|uniref:tyrosine-protein phosphatase n=1 Tax=Oceanobacillus jeddahense TaxID=1462527 RepID=UPI000595B692|nr:tyrosine-protein phosphatase [Oceanobacillus jeddahense]